MESLQTESDLFFSCFSGAFHMTMQSFENIRHYMLWIIIFYVWLEKISGLFPTLIQHQQVCSSVCYITDGPEHSKYIVFDFLK